MTNKCKHISGLWKHWLPTFYHVTGLKNSHRCHNYNHDLLMSVRFFFSFWGKCLKNSKWYFKVIFHWFILRSRRPAPVPTATPRMDSPMPVIPHQKVPTHLQQEETNQNNFTQSMQTHHVCLYHLSCLYECLWYLFCPPVKLSIRQCPAAL